MASKIRRANTSQLVAIIDAVREHCSKGENGLAVYAPGWDDQILADHLGVSKASVAKIRLDQFGLIRRVEKMPDTTLASVLELIDHLQHRVAALEEWARDQPESDGPTFEGHDVPPLLRRNGT